jgi:hypothetical protein
MNWKQKLLTAREQWFLKKYQAAREFGVPFSGLYSDQTTNGLTRCVCDFLKFNGHYYNRVNSQGQVRLETVQLSNGGSFKKAKWTYGTSNRGTADITAIIFGKHVAIEIKCKGTRDRIRPTQLIEKRRIEAAGGIYYIATDMESFTGWYEQIIQKIKEQ